MRGKIQDGTVKNAVAMKAECVVQRNNPIEAVVIREMDIAEWVLGDRFNAVFALTDNNRVMHLIGRMNSGARVTLDLTNGLNEQTRETERHEVIAADGDMCDLPVGMQFASEDIYAFNSEKKEPETFTGVIIEDEFYTREEAQILRDAMSVINNENEQIENENEQIENEENNNIENNPNENDNKENPQNNSNNDIIQNLNQNEKQKVEMSLMKNRKNNKNQKNNALIKQQGENDQVRKYQEKILKKEKLNDKKVMNNKKMKKKEVKEDHDLVSLKKKRRKRNLIIKVL